MNDYAVANDLIIVYPQADASLLNPFGCWDTFGYSGDKTFEKGSVQGEFLMNLIQRMTEPLDSGFAYQDWNLLGMDDFSAWIDSVIVWFFDIPQTWTNFWVNVMLIVLFTFGLL